MHLLNAAKIAEVAGSNPFLQAVSTQLVHPGATMQIGGFEIEVRGNNYVTFKDKNLLHLFPKPKGINSESPTYPGLADAVHQAIHIDQRLHPADLAREVQKVMRGHSTAEPLAAILAASLGGAETLRNPHSFAMMLMYTDLILAGEASWERGLGPTSILGKSRKPVEKNEAVLGYYGVSNMNQIPGIMPQKLAVIAEALKLTGAEPALQSDFVKLGKKQKAKITVGDIGGEIPMTGGETVALGKAAYPQKKGECYSKVHTKEAALMFRWLALKLGNDQNLWTKSAISQELAKLLQ